MAYLIPQTVNFDIAIALISSRPLISLVQAPVITIVEARCCRIIHMFQGHFPATFTRSTNLIPHCQEPSIFADLGALECSNLEKHYFFFGVSTKNVLLKHEMSTQSN